MVGKKFSHSFPHAPCQALILLCFLLSSAQSNAAPAWPFRHYNRESGLALDSVHALCRDRQGFLWIGTPAFLIRYDGQRFREYSNKDGLPAGAVHSIHETADGNLWIGTTNGLGYRTEQGFGVLSRFPGAGVSRDGALASKNGRLYAATRLGLIRGETRPDSEFELIPVPAAVGSSATTAIDIDSEGNVWVICGRTLCALRSDSLEIIGRSAGLPDSAWTSVRRDAAGTLWIRDSEQLWSLPKGQTSFQQWPEKLLTSNYAELYLDPEGQLAMPGPGGVRFLSGKPAPLIGQQQGLPADHVGNLLWDKEGNLWLGLPHDGLARLKGKGLWTYWTADQGLTANTITGIQRDVRGRLWVGSRLGISVLEPDGQWRNYSQREGLPQNEIRGMLADPSGGLWVGSGLGGLARMDTLTGRLRAFGPAEDLPDDHIVTIDSSGPDDVWIITRNGVFRTPVKGPWSFEKMDFPTVGDAQQVYRVKRAKDGSIWAVGHQGLMHQENGRWRIYGPEIGLRDRQLVFLTLGHDGSTWVGYGRPMGISRIEWPASGPRVSHYSVPDFMNSEDISFLEADVQGRIWVGTEKGVVVFDGTEWHRFQRDDGLVWEDILLNAFHADADGTIWIGTNRGLASFRAPARLEHPAHPPVTITSVRAGLRELDLQTPLLSWKERPLVFQFACLTLANDIDVRFRYRLSDQESSWLETSRGEVLFPELASGSHAIEVTSSLRGGPWNPNTTRLDFYIEPRWWESWWVRSLILLLVFGAVAGTWLWRIKVHVRRQQELEAIVGERTSGLIQANENIRQQMEERERAVREKEQLEEQLLQSRKMEALGRLAGGVAHDFNNLLTVINGYSEMALENVRADEPVHAQLSEIKKAGERAADLTRQLLAFSRRQVLQTRVLDLNEIVREMGTMLQRLLTENIELVMKLSPFPAPIKADHGQMHQVLLNLVVNARDAMPRGGVLTIETDHVHLEEDAIPGMGNVAAGDYVCLMITDTGAGMSEETKAHLFEPFFTTKPKGQGTGLGLSMVFGIVSQSEGRIHVVSRPGKGSSFRLYFPRSEETEKRENFHVSTEKARGSETILVVEDQPSVRSLVRESLERQGYHVLEASNGNEALQVYQTNRAAIQLLITDVIMPGMDGGELAGRIRSSNAAMKIIFISGYSDSLVGPMELRIGSGADYIQKPFAPQLLIEKVREMLISP
jgi:signal transduction histidine kinase/ligand-binding sensor domain-containing protein/CheY-like chemotaxis protein